MQTTIEKDGKDLVVIIPTEILDRAGLKVGDEVDITMKNGAVVIESQKGDHCE